MLPFCLKEPNHIFVTNEQAVKFLQKNLLVLIIEKIIASGGRLAASGSRCLRSTDFSLMLNVFNIRVNGGSTPAS